jgi:hypothetical protein
VLNNAVWDIDNNLVLKLAEDKKISIAYRGWKKLSDEEIKDVYGPNMTFLSLKWPETNRVFEKTKGAHWVLMGQ